MSLINGQSRHEASGEGGGARDGLPTALFGAGMINIKKIQIQIKGINGEIEVIDIPAHPTDYLNMFY